MPGGRMAVLDEDVSGARSVVGGNVAVGEEGSF